jgi:hypothetical protein
LHYLKHLRGTVEALGRRAPNLLHEVLRSAVALSVGGDLFFLSGEVYTSEVLLELTEVEVTEVA